jgi:hypothetical protein
MFTPTERTVFVSLVCVFSLIWAGFAIHVWYNSSLAVVVPDWTSKPIGASELSDLIAAVSTTEERDTPKTTRLKPGTQCRVVALAASEFACSADSGVMRIKILAGDRKGQLYWICSRDLRMMYPPGP